MEEKWRGWAKHSINQGPEGGRDIDRYAQEINRNPVEYARKRTLEIGSGGKLKFARDLEKMQIQAEVVSVSPAFTQDAARERALYETESDASKLVVAAEGAALPFPDNSFDRVVSLHVAEHVPTRAYLLDMIKEAVRVVRPLGTVDVMPLWDAPNTSNELHPELFAALDDLAGTASWELRDPVPPYNKVTFSEDGQRVSYEQKILTLTKKESVD